MAAYLNKTNSVLLPLARLAMLGHGFLGPEMVPKASRWNSWWVAPGLHWNHFVAGIAMFRFEIAATTFTGQSERINS